MHEVCSAVGGDGVAFPMAGLASKRKVPFVAPMSSCGPQPTGRPPHKWWFESSLGRALQNCRKLPCACCPRACMSAGGLGCSWSNFDFIDNDERNKLARSLRVLFCRSFRR
eukprot:366349-Chlamydomonas_euryale.AAC.6